ncbi:MAG: hypothetical protein JRH01_20365 [Deltaproteobacteria bacterium]|nr:hypothetical protein [Deltaproteobacteria bacterium]MBW2396504.1 hypothetical protein [Deltaproteobacteria bacterium]
MLASPEDRRGLPVKSQGEFSVSKPMPVPDGFKEISPARRIPVLRDTELVSGYEALAGTKH